MDQKNTESAASYYNRKRKHSFLYSRIFVVVSMVLLLVVLGVNISAMTTTQTTTKSQASSDEETISTLPSPPAGCSYHNIKGTVSISCTTPMPKKTGEEDVALDYPLPALPTGCSYHTTNKGYSFLCAQAQVATVSAAVTLPSTCILGSGTSAIRCSNPAGQTRTVQLPPLPLGCEYIKGNNTLATSCHQ